jgi:predicted GNAT family acetyltransferase
MSATPLVTHDEKKQRFETHLDGHMAYMSYSFHGEVVDFDHTYVPGEFRGRGVAGALVRAGLEEARRQRWKVVPSCSYVAAYIERHSEYSDLLA